jgi:hypothetical protein
MNFSKSNKQHLKDGAKLKIKNFNSLKYATILSWPFLRDVSLKWKVSNEFYVMPLFY